MNQIWRTQKGQPTGVGTPGGGTAIAVTIGLPEVAGELQESAGSRRTVPLRCSCGCTFAQLRDDGAVVIVSRHHGQKCVNVLTMDELARLQEEVLPKR